MSASVNRYAAPCEVCGCEVPPGGGRLARNGRRWAVSHLACAEGDRAGTPAVVEVVIGRHRYTRNARGTCEDAPCCGCCTF
jgi:hypothetical protein